MSDNQIQIESEIGQQLKQSISSKLSQLDLTEDTDYVAEFIIVLISNNRSPGEIVQELNALFGNVITEDFIQGTFNDIALLQNAGQQQQPQQQQQQLQEQQGQQEQAQQGQQQADQQERQQVRFGADVPANNGSDQLPNLPTAPSASRSFANNNRFNNGGISKSSFKQGANKRNNFALKNQQNFAQAMDMAMSNNDQQTTQFVQRKPLGRCVHYPYCKNKTCQFAHPGKTCFAFPNCSNAPGTCNYLHPGEDDLLIAEIEKARQMRISKLQNGGQQPFNNGGLPNTNRLVNQVTRKVEQQLMSQSQGITLCKFGAVCQKELCPFGHPTPSNRDQKVVVLQWCPENKNCTDTNCQKAHSSPNFQPSSAPAPFQPQGASNGGQSAGTEKSLEQCKFGQYCKNFRCPKRHATSTVMCREGANCTRIDCFFQHPLDEDCKFGVNCKNQNCAFKHPEGRQLGPAKSNVWVNNNSDANVSAATGTSERKFAVADDQVMEQAPQQEA